MLLRVHRLSAVSPSVGQTEAEQQARMRKETGARTCAGRMRDHGRPEPPIAVWLPSRWWLRLANARRWRLAVSKLACSPRGRSVLYEK